MNLVFLDIDGVLNSLAWFEENGIASEHALGRPDTAETWLEMIDPAAVARLNRIVAGAYAAVVISSSWRHYHSHEDIAALLRRRGFVGDVVGATTTSYGLVPNATTERGHQIAHYLDASPAAAFVILDDESDMAHLKPRHIKTDWATGLLDEHVLAALEMFRA